MKALITCKATGHHATENDGVMQPMASRCMQGSSSSFAVLVGWVEEVGHFGRLDEESPSNRVAEVGQLISTGIVKVSTYVLLMSIEQ